MTKINDFSPYTCTFCINIRLYFVFFGYWKLLPEAIFSGNLPVIGCRGDPRSPADFAQQNPSPQGAHSYFPSENPKNAVFRRATEGRPYGALRNIGSSTA